MKKLILFLFFALISACLFSQEYVKVANGIKTPGFYYIGGTGTDTLANRDTLKWSIPVKLQQNSWIAGRMSVTKVTGTISDTTYFYGSFDGITKDHAIDSIFCSNASTGYKYLNQTRWVTFAYPYLLIWNWSKGANTAKSVRKFLFNVTGN
jgi:hypothetical protein